MGKNVDVWKGLGRQKQDIVLFVKMNSIMKYYNAFPTYVKSKKH